MANASYHVFGVGLGTQDLHYIGWTKKSVSDEQEQIVSELQHSSNNDIARWVEKARQGGNISVFEIESAPSMEEAKNSAAFLRQYFHSLGLNVISDLA